MKNRIQQRHVAAVVIALLTAGLGLALYVFPLGRGLIHASYDFLIVLRGEKPANEAVIVYLDEKSHQQLHQPLNAPWDRTLHAKLIDRLTAAGAKAIVFDVVFSDPSVAGPGADATLAKAIKASARVILAADRVPLGPGQAKAILPIDLLLDGAAGFGSAEVLPDPDLVVRRHTPDEEFAGFQLPSLAWAAAEFVRAPATTNNAARQQHRWMNYYGPPGTLRSASYADALDPAVVPDVFFRDKVVFIGSRIITKFAGERKDEYRNPFAFFMSREMIEARGAMFIPGVEIQATACVNLLHGDWWSRLPEKTERWIIVLLGLVVGVGLTRLKPLPATLVAVLALAALVFVCQLAAAQLSWFVLFLVAVQIGFALVVAVAYNSIHAYVQRRLAEQSLALYLSPKLVKKFSTEPKLLKPGAEKQVLTLFFSDIADFTRISEGMDSDHLAHMMNGYFETAVSQCIHKTDGTVVKYIGDAIFAFWNAPETQVDHTLRACEAALHFRKVQGKAPDGSPLRTRVGIHTGEANVGNFGSVERVDYTALGENVNLASRLEGLNKHLGTECLISGATKAGVGDQLVTRTVGRFQLKGFEKPVEVYELLGWPEEAEATRPWREAFEQALQNYQSGDMILAEMGFRRTLELHPNDGPAQHYLARLEELSAQPLQGDWTGVTMMKEK